MKRMIDNKEYEALKSDVSEVKAEIGNIKSIPTITIDASQMLSESTAQLTDEQFEIIENNSFINVVMPNSQSFGFNCFIDAYEDYHLALCEGGASEISYFSVSINSSTKVATISMGTFQSGKKLYQHLVHISLNATNDFGSCELIITNDNNTQINTKELLCAFLVSVGRKLSSGGSVSKYYLANGVCARTNPTSKYGVVIGVVSNYAETNPQFVVKIDGGNTLEMVGGTMEITDTIITL